MAYFSDVKAYLYVCCRLSHCYYWFKNIFYFLFYSFIFDVILKVKRGKTPYINLKPLQNENKR